MHSCEPMWVVCTEALFFVFATALLFLEYIYFRVRACLLASDINLRHFNCILFFNWNDPSRGREIESEQNWWHFVLSCSSGGGTIRATQIQEKTFYLNIVTRSAAMNEEKCSFYLSRYLCFARLWVANLVCCKCAVILSNSYLKDAYESLGTIYEQMSDSARYTGCRFLTGCDDGDERIAIHRFLSNSKFYCCDQCVRVHPLTQSNIQSHTQSATNSVLVFYIYSGGAQVHVPVTEETFFSEFSLFERKFGK